MSNAFLTFFTLAEVWLGLLGLAAFLALYWVLRGAPIGQSVHAEDDEESPRGGYRDRVVAAVCVGMLLIALGGYLAIVRGVGWSIPAFALGFGTVIALVVVNQRYRHASPTLRRALRLSTAALNLSLVAGILIVANVIAFRYGGRPLDLTRERAYSLSPLSRNVFKSLARPVTFTTFFGRSGPALQQKDRVDQLLDLYRAVNPEMVRLDHVDPFREPTRYDALTRRIKDVEITQGGGVVVEYGEGDAADHVVVRNLDLFDIPAGARFNPEVQSVRTVFKGEDAITAAIMRLRESKKPTIVFTTGHGEPSIEEMELVRPGLGFWKARLSATGWEVTNVNLLNQDLPADTAVVVIVGPKSPFKPEEIARLRAYTDRKGPMLVLLGEAATTGLEDFLKGFDVERGSGVIVEPRRNYNGKPDLLAIQVQRATNPIVAVLENEVLLVPGSSPLRIGGQKLGTPASAGLLSTVLLRSSGESWAETQLAGPVKRDEKDESGPFNLGVALTDRPPAGERKAAQPRLVVFSSRYLGDNQIVQKFPPNLDLLMNTVNWLRGRSDGDGGIAPKPHLSMTLDADPVVRFRLVMVPTVMACLLIVVLGVTTYLARRY